MINKNSGIYKIENTVTGDFYIGSSKNLKKRKYTHFYCLKRNKHANIFLQRCFNKTPENFIFREIFLCDEKFLLHYEQILINEHLPVYNIGSVGGGDNYSTLPDEIKAEIRRKQSHATTVWWESLSAEEYHAVCASRQGESNPNFQNVWDERKRKIARETALAAISRNPNIITKLSDGRDRWLQETSAEERSAVHASKKVLFTGEGNPFHGKTHSESTIESIVKKGKATREQKEMLLGYEKAYTTRPFYIEGIRYSSLKYASESTGIPKGTIKRRLDSKNFPNYVYVNVDHA